MQKDGAGNLSTLYTYGNQRINSESINNLSGIYTYDGRGSVSSVIGGFGDYRATYWYDGLGNVIRNLYGAGDSNNRYKPYYGYNAESYNPVTGNQNLRARQLNIRRQRFLTEDTYLGNKTDVLSINRYIYGNDNPLRYTDPSGNGIFFPFEKLSDFTINMFDKNVTKGGGGIADYIQQKEDRLTNIIDSASKMSESIQCGSDIYGGLTLRGLDISTFLTGGFAGFRTMVDNSGNHIITTNYWTWQGSVGFANIYNHTFHAFTLTDNDKINIGNEYTIWLWKGDYLNLGAGGEIGIYNGTGNAVSTTMSDKLGISMTMEITDSVGNSIVNINKQKTWLDNLTGNDPNENWWLTGWNPNKQGLTNKDLNMTGTLDFSQSKDPSLYDKLKDAYDYEINDYFSELKSEWEFDDRRRIAKFKWRY